MFEGQIELRSAATLFHPVALGLTGSILNFDPSASSILLVRDVFHPLDHLAIEHFLNGDMRHRSCRRRAVPMLLVRREPDDIARPDFFDRSALALRPTKA